MKYIILCGGEGSRNKNYSLPKPLNYINGKHMIEYIINNISNKEIYIIYNSNLDLYNFREIVINKCKTKDLYFSKLDYFTRGAVESAYVGIKKFRFSNNENIVFIDNDNLHTFPSNMESVKFENDFIGYSIDYSKTNYSYITIDEDCVSDIIEKKKISDFYCCGLYGFKNYKSFIEIAEFVVKNNIMVKNEFYFSQLYKSLLDNNKKINTFYIEKTEHIGSLDEILTTSSLNLSNKLRICFDLDNTLVTYPQIPGDYSTVKPIESNIKLLKDLKEAGHEITIHTARRMQTHNNNIGKDIGIITFNTLEKFDIPYDEIIFGKPIADIYIDDKALNPYVSNISYFGIFNKKENDILNKIPNNKYNTISRIGDSIYKNGPVCYLKGEAFFYQNIPDDLKHLFLDFYSLTEVQGDNLQIEIKYIKCIPLFYLYKNELVSDKTIKDLFRILDDLHSFKTSRGLEVNDTNIKNNYILKITKRFSFVEDYPFEDVHEVFEDIITGLNKYYSSEVVDIIHGDFWFSNILLTYNNEYKLIDMKGQVDNILTLNGDRYYDYGKFYQSVLGYDLILNGIELNREYISKIHVIFLENCEQIGLNIEYLKYVTKSLIFGSFHFFNEDNIKNREAIWELIKSIK